MRVSVVQNDPVFGATKINTQAAIGHMESSPADLHVLPELFAIGYNFVNAEETSSLAEDLTGPTYQTIAAFCKRAKSHVVYGFAERADKIYNSAAVVGPQGLVGVYRKVHLYYRETLFFAPGNLGFPVFDLPFGKIGVMICFDWFYPESARSLALKGAQLIAHPSNLVMPYCPDAMITRCLENRVFAATADRVGTEDRGGVTFTYIGTSEIVSPRGEILQRLNTTSPGTAVADIDLSLGANKRLNEFNDLLQGRRPESYG